MVLSEKHCSLSDETQIDAIPAIMDAAEMCLGDTDNGIEDYDEMIEEETFGEDDDYGDGEEEIFEVDDGTKQTAETNKFDLIVGALEEILMDPEFEYERDTFCRDNCLQFEDSDENKLVYMDLFQKYTTIIETMIDSQLSQRVEEFDMQEFLEMLDSRQDELCTESFDLLMSMGDFQAFKEMMLAYKAEVVDGKSFEISCLSMHIHNEEQEDGDQRPDLDFGLSIAPLAVASKS